MVFFTVKRVYPYPWTSYPYQTPPVKHLPDPTHTCGYGSGTGIPAGRGRPAHLCLPIKIRRG